MYACARLCFCFCVTDKPSGKKHTMSTFSTYSPTHQKQCFLKTGLQSLNVRRCAFLRVYAAFIVVSPFVCCSNTCSVYIFKIQDSRFIDKKRNMLQCVLICK